MSIQAMAELWELSAIEVAAGIAARSFSSEEVTTALLARIERYDPHLRAFITVDPEQAIAAARAADNADRAGPLHGVPIAIKDNIATRGLRTTAGSRVLATWVPERDAPVISTLHAAGAVVLGKTNLHEFAYGGTCTNVEFGAVRNPWHLEHVPGGSSGGSGAAVAAALCPAALGSDTAGSVRLPAAQCGVVGLKPTYGRISIDGVIPLAWSLDHVGPMARTVADVALLHAVLARTPPAPATGRAIAGLRLGVPRAYFFDGLQPDVAAAVDAALTTLSDLGAVLVDTEWPGVDVSNSATWTIILAEASAYHRPWFRTRPEDYAAETRHNLELGEFVPASDYIQAQRVRTVLQASVRELLHSVDALVTPSLAITAPRIGQTTVEVGGKVKEINPVFIRLADPFNLTGLPAISVPCGFGADGLPIGLQIAAAPFAEDTVLRVAAAYEASTTWHTRRPALDEVTTR
jgi:aspartyl-tRNA(Asn)/glutamyl-tRNA(Gln) amidotransferase subunit A